MTDAVPQTNETAGFYERHFVGPGGIRGVFAIAFPMVVSSATFTVMIVIDRVFLSRLGSEYISASASGGLMAFMTVTFFFGLLGYVNALVAQHLGAGNRHRCSVVTTQGMIVGLCGYPLVLCCLPLGLWLLRVAGHEQAQQLLERQYFTVLALGALFTFLGQPLRSFFTGIGRTRVVMLASFVAMVVNIGLNYLLIFGKFGLPRLEIVGAGIGTVAGNLAGLLVLIRLYLRPANREAFGIDTSFIFDRAEMRRLLRFGTPAGVEFFLNLAAFNLFVQMFHSYGRDTAAAMTITFNWDMVAFFPMVGVNLATMSLVGRYMGAKNVPAAERAAFSGLKLALAYGGTFALLFLLWPGLLVGVFTPDMPGLDYERVAPLAKSMLRLAALYTLSDATALVIGGALRGAGDTTWCMRASVLLHWTMAIVAFLMIRVMGCAPFLVWQGFVLMVMLMGSVYYYRFHTGLWKELRVLDEPVATIADDAVSEAGPV